MKTITVLVIAIVSVVGILLMTTLASRTMAPVHKVHTSPHSALKHGGAQSIGCPWHGGCTKGRGLSPAGAVSPDTNGIPTSDRYAERGDFGRQADSSWDGTSAAGGGGGGPSAQWLASHPGWSPSMGDWQQITYAQTLAASQGQENWKKHGSWDAMKKWYGHHHHPHQTTSVTMQRPAIHSSPHDHSVTHLIN